MHILLHNQDILLTKKIKVLTNFLCGQKVSDKIADNSRMSISKWVHFVIDSHLSDTFITGKDNTTCLID